jgi:hypothetical protein
MDFADAGLPAHHSAWDGSSASAVSAAAIFLLNTALGAGAPADAWSGISNVQVLC